MAKVIYTISESLQASAGALLQTMEAEGLDRHYIAPLECTVVRPKARDFQLRITQDNVLGLGSTEKEANHTIAALMYGIRMSFGKA